MIARSASALLIAALASGCAANAGVVSTGRFEFHNYENDKNMTVSRTTVVVDKKAKAGEDIVDVTHSVNSHPAVGVAQTVILGGAAAGSAHLLRPSKYNSSTNVDQSGGGASSGAFSQGGAAGNSSANAAGGKGVGGGAVSVSNSDQSQGQIQGQGQGQGQIAASRSGASAGAAAGASSIAGASSNNSNSNSNSNRNDNF